MLSVLILHTMAIQQSSQPCLYFNHVSLEQLPHACMSPIYPKLPVDITRAYPCGIESNTWVVKLVWLVGL